MVLKYLVEFECAVVEAYLLFYEFLSAFGKQRPFDITIYQDSTQSRDVCCQELTWRPKINEVTPLNEIK